MLARMKTRRRGCRSGTWSIWPFERPKRAPVARQLSLLPTEPIVTTGSPLRPRKPASSTTCAVSDAPDLEEVLPRDANASERGQGIQAADDIAAAALSRE